MLPNPRAGRGALELNSGGGHVMRNHRPQLRRSPQTPISSFHRRPSVALSGRAPESATAAGNAYLRIVAHTHPFERGPHPVTGRPADGPRARPRRPWRSGDPPARSCLRKRGRSDVRITRPVQRRCRRPTRRTTAGYFRPARVVWRPALTARSSLSACSKAASTRCVLVARGREAANLGPKSCEVLC